MMKKVFISIFVVFCCISRVFALTQDEASDKLAKKGLNADNHAQFMYCIVNEKDYEAVELFAIAQKVDVNQLYFGNSPLVHSLYTKQPEIAMVLLKHGADPKTPRLGAGSALYFAVKYGYTDVVREMLKDPNLNIKRERMLFRKPYAKTAHNNGYFEIEKMLIEHQKQYEAAHSATNTVIRNSGSPFVIIRPHSALPENTDAI